MREISRTKKLEVALGFMQGHGYAEIEDKAGVSHGTVVNIVKELETGKLDIPGGPFDRVNDLRQLSVDLRKKEMSTSQALLGLSFFQRCGSLGIGLEQLDGWADLVAKVSNAEFPKEDFFGAALRLRQLENTEGKPSETLVEEYVKTREHLGKLTAEIDALTVKKKRLTKEIGPLSNRVNTLTKQRGDREAQLNTLVKKIDESKAKVMQGEKEKARLLKQIEELGFERTRLFSEVKGKEESLTRINSLGLQDEDLLRLRAIVKRMAADNSTDAKGIQEKFFTALSTFQSLVELDKRTEVEWENLRKLTEKQSSLGGEIQELEKTKAVLQGEIGQAASSVTEGIKVVGEKSVAELQAQVADIRGKFNALMADALRTAAVVGEMKAMVKKGEESEKGITHFIAEVKAGLGGN